MYSLSYVTLIVEHNRFFDMALRCHAGFSTTEYCILQQLNAYGDEASSTVFQEFLLLKPNSITSAIARLEKRGFIKKALNKADSRSFILTITKSGRKVCEESSRDIQQTLTKWFWVDPNDDRIYWTMKEHAKLGRKKSHHMVSGDASDEKFIMPGWVVETKYLQQMWTAGVQKYAKMSLSSFRILSKLCESRGELSAGDLARQLVLSKSTLSVFLKDLKKRGLVSSKQSHADHRVTLFSPTKKGNVLEVQIKEELVNLTEKHFEPVPKDRVAALNAWHHTMFDNYISQIRFL